MIKALYELTPLNEEKQYSLNIKNQASSINATIEDKIKIKEKYKGYNTIFNKRIFYAVDIFNDLSHPFNYIKAYMDTKLFKTI